MKKTIIGKKLTALALAATMLLGMSTGVYATEVTEPETSDTVDAAADSDTSDATVDSDTDASTADSDTSDTASDSTADTDSDEKPYLALGADLTADEQHTALALLGLDASQLDQYDVVYVNNKEEHKYLDAYIDSDTIGSRSLSCVKIIKTAEGSGINVTTYNINYCTAGMYTNALETAGITDADVYVAGPFSISGTAALIGTFEAYGAMTGDKLDKSVVDAALDELVTTGALEAAIDADPEDVEAVIAELKEMLANGQLDTEEDILNAIAQLEEEYDITFTDDEKQTIIDLINKFKKADLSWLDGLYESGFFEKFGQIFSDIFGSIWDTIQSWFN